jgi:hypothetical protein
VNQIELFAVVFQVASDAILAIGITHLELRVVAVPVGKRLGDFLMAIQAFERGRTGPKLMATAALGRATKGGMRSRKRPG